MNAGWSRGQCHSSSQHPSGNLFPHVPICPSTPAPLPVPIPLPLCPCPRKQAAPGPTLLLVRDSGGAVFGGYAPLPWQKSGTFYGDMASFIFSLEPAAQVGACLEGVPGV